MCKGESRQPRINWNCALLILVLSYSFSFYFSLKKTQNNWSIQIICFTSFTLIWFLFSSFRFSIQFRFKPFKFYISLVDLYFFFFKHKSQMNFNQQFKQIKECSLKWIVWIKLSFDFSRFKQSGRVLTCDTLYIVLLIMFVCVDQRPKELMLLVIAKSKFHRKIYLLWEP